LTNDASLDWSLVVVPGAASDLPTVYAANTSSGSIFRLHFDAGQGKMVVDPSPIAMTWRIFDLVRGDFNDDGKQDLAVLDVANAAEPVIHVLLGPDFMTVVNSTPLTLATSRLRVADLLGDHKDKIVYVGQVSASQSEIWTVGYQNGGLLATRTPFSTPDVSRSFLVPLNLGGKPDSPQDLLVGVDRDEILFENPGGAFDANFKFKEAAHYGSKSVVAVNTPAGHAAEPRDA